MSTYSRSLSPPPPLPSPQLLPTSLPSPPTFPGSRLPRRRLHILSQPSSPAPIPPRLIGSPLLNKTLNISRSFERINEEAKATLWVDGDEFGSNRPESERMKDKEQYKLLSSPSFPSKRASRRPSPVHIPYHSPPPSPTITSPPPPVPPIPAFLLSAYHKKPVLHTPPSLPTWPAKIVPVPCHPERHTLRRKRGLSAPHHHGRAAGLTCSQFMTMRNEPRRMGRITAM